MSEYLIAGNWKMNGSQASIKSLLQGIVQQAGNSANVEFAVMSPYPYLPQLAESLSNTQIKFGAQDVSKHDSGAYTGEVSAAMLTDFGCHYVIVGHSERRAYHQESNGQVACKFAKVQQQGMTPILCVGETLEQREQQQTLAVIREQIQAVLDLPDGIKQFSQAVIAYEPVWAIGTGKTATPEQAQQVHQAIREQLAGLDRDIANKIAILYGGSVKPSNAAELFAQADINGALVGGASLKVEDFIGIGQAAVN